MTHDVVADPRPTFRPAPGRAAPATSRDTLSFLAVAATFVGTAALFCISPIALESRGIAYIDAGGGLFAKFHPATPVIVAAFLLRCLAARRPVHAAWRLLTDDSGAVLLLSSVGIAAVFAAFVDKTPVTPLADTFVLTALLFLLLRDLDRAALRRLAALVALILVVNAGMALLEFLRGFHVITAPPPPGVTDDPTKANEIFSWKADLAVDWRAEALLGHPLVNGLVVGSFILCLMAPAAAWVPLAIRLPLVGLQALSMFCFGARTSLVLTTVLAAWLLLSQFGAAIDRGARLSAGRMAPVVLGLGVALVAVLVLGYSGFLDKTLNRFANDDGSASTRLTMFALLTPMPFSDLMLHPDKDLVDTLQRVYGLEFGIESSWIGLTLTYGLVVAGLVVAGIAAFWRSILRATGGGSAAACILYVTLVSVTASLSGKTTSFAMVTALVLLFLRKDGTVAAATAPSMECRVHGPA